jgi:hypothetical protein
MLKWQKEYTQKAVENALKLYRPPSFVQPMPLKRTQSAGDICRNSNVNLRKRSAVIAGQPPALSAPPLGKQRKRSDEQEPSTDELEPGICKTTAAASGDLETSSTAPNADANTTTPHSTGVSTSVKKIADDLETEMDQRQLSFDNYANNLSPVSRNNSHGSISPHQLPDEEKLLAINTSLDRRQGKYSGNNWDSLDQTDMEDGGEIPAPAEEQEEEASSESSGLPAPSEFSTTQDSTDVGSIAAFVKSNRRETPVKTEEATVGQTAKQPKTRTLKPRQLAPVFQSDKTDKKKKK